MQGADVITSACTSTQACMQRQHQVLRGCGQPQLHAQCCL
jgi:hypothetical protein